MKSRRTQRPWRRAPASWTRICTITSARPPTSPEETHPQSDEFRAGLVFGSRTLWNDLLVAGLVDELHLIVGPVILRGGTPAFGTEPPAPLRLLGARTWEDTDNVLIWYAPADRAS